MQKSTETSQQPNSIWFCDRSNRNSTISVGKYTYSVDSKATFLLTDFAFSIPEPFFISIIQLMGGSTAFSYKFVFDHRDCFK
ncbi:hypothetical protein M3Y98_00018100 [Aphelenchoides besseyi]|nr:hypothetical protein M3Y98_00018100 [Aphelenchoides besseyi]